MKEIKRQVLRKAPKVTCISVLLLSALILSAFTDLALAQTGNLGWNPTHPNLPLRQNTPDYILTGKVGVAVDPVSKEATLSFSTFVPTRNATVYYDLYTLQQMTAMPQMPQYNHSVREQSIEESTIHEVKLNLEQFQEQDYALDSAKEGGIINYKISLQDPETKSLVNYNGRFGIDKDCNWQPCVVEGPFVDLLKPYGATISFDTDSPTDALAFIDGKTYSDGLTAEHHEIEITGLKADTYYDYSLALNGQNGMRTYSFKTAPDLGSTSFKFAFMSDSRGCSADGDICSAGGINYDVLSRFMIDAFNRKADLLVFGGDLVNGYCTNEDDYRLQLDAWKDASELVGSTIPIYEAVGNHEALMDVYEDGSAYGICLDKPDGPGKSAETVFAEEFVNPKDSFPATENASSPGYSENAYYFDYANSRFIILNTNYWYSSDPFTYGGNQEGFVMDNQLQWVASLLDDARDNPYIKHIFLIGHEPVFPNDGELDEPYLFQRKVALWKLLSQNSKVAAAFFGHEHSYSRMEVDERTPLSSNKTDKYDFKYSVWQVISGNVGAPAYAQGGSSAPWSTEVKAFYPARHYCLISVEGDKVELQVISDFGEIVDKCMLSVGPKAPSNVVNKDAKQEKAPCPCKAKKERAMK
jgi:3',5'-cyclic-AMP phosphodiesterase